MPKTRKKRTKKRPEQAHGERILATSDEREFLYCMDVNLGYSYDRLQLAEIAAKHALDPGGETGKAIKALGKAREKLTEASECFRLAVADSLKRQQEDTIAAERAAKAEPEPGLFEKEG